MTSIETLLEQRARDWVAGVPEPPPLSELAARARSARRSTSRWLMPALAAASVVVIVALALFIVANAHHDTSTRPGSSTGLTAAQRSLAIRIALREASTANPAPPGPRPAAVDQLAFLRRHRRRHRAALRAGPSTARRDPHG